MSVRAPVPDLAAGSRTLASETSHYLCRVLRLRAGDAFVAFDPTATPRREADAVVEVASGEAAVVRLSEPRPAKVFATAPLVVVYGLAKGDKVDAVVRDATELGATHLVLTPTARAIVKLDAGRGDAKVARWTKIAEQAARQCGRADPPTVTLAGSLGEALATAEGVAAARFCLWEEATAPLGPPLAEAIARGSGIAFLIGPEGGLAREEVDLATTHGFTTMSLGPFVLRTETVAAAVLGAVRILSG